MDTARMVLRPITRDAEDGDHLPVTWTDNVDGALGSGTGGISNDLDLKTPGRTSPPEP